MRIIETTGEKRAELAIVAVSGSEGRILPDV